MIVTLQIVENSMTKDVKNVVSVIIPTYGRSDYIIRCIESVILQSYKAIEIIVVDDNGKGSYNQIETERKLSSYSAKQYINYIVRETNGGGALARNDGILASTGEYITFLDDDDEYLPIKIEKQLFHIKDKNVDISLCGAFYIDDEGNIENYKGRPSGDSLESFLLNGRALTPMIMVRKESILKAGGFVATPRFQDHVFMLNLLGSGATVAISYERLYKCYRHSGERISRSSKSLNGYLIKHEVERKYADCLTNEQRNILEFTQRKELLRFKSGTPFIKEVVKLSRMPNSSLVSLLKILIKLAIGRDKV